MEQALNQFNQQVQNLPLYDQVTGLYEDQMGERFSTKDPFYEKVPKKDPGALERGEKMEYDEVRRRPPPNIDERQRKLWKKIMKRAWYHDRNFCGCMPIDLGCGMISIVSIFPIIGSIIAYKMHYKMIKMCHQAGCPAKLEAIMVGNIGVDFLMTLVPLLGVLMSWMKASSTRNAALFDTWLREESTKQEKLRQTQINRQQQLARQTNSNVQQPARAAQQAPQRQQSPARAQPAPSAQRAQTRPAQSPQARAAQPGRAPTGTQPAQNTSVPRQVQSQSNWAQSQGQPRQAQPRPPQTRPPQSQPPQSRPPQSRPPQARPAQAGQPRQVQSRQQPGQGPPMQPPHGQPGRNSQVSRVPVPGQPTSQRARAPAAQEFRAPPQPSHPPAGMYQHPPMQYQQRQYPVAYNQGYKTETYSADSPGYYNTASAQKPPPAGFHPPPAGTYPPRPGPPPAGTYYTTEYV